MRERWSNDPEDDHAELPSDESNLGQSGEFGDEPLGLMAELAALRNEAEMMMKGSDGL